MNILDKFSSVEIKADNRISEDDKAFCQRQQEAFDKSGVALQKLADLMISATVKQNTIFAENIEDPGGYLSSQNFRCDEKQVYTAMKHRKACRSIGNRS